MNQILNWWISNVNFYISHVFDIRPAHQAQTNWNIKHMKIAFASQFYFHDEPTVDSSVEMKCVGRREIIFIHKLPLALCRE